VGHAKAQFNLGVCYGSNAGVEHDFAAARSWLARAAAAGNTVATGALAELDALETAPTRPDASEAAP